MHARSHLYRAVLVKASSLMMLSSRVQESHNRAARQRIPHRVYTDGEGQEHVQVCVPV